ncbi:MAG: DUF3108 domain-containing protein [Candidatus Cloacimonetes bacterium]|nr:DUF3108 domain-containing protein [Candidatus Cloacimonadota bacterium]
MKKTIVFCLILFVSSFSFSQNGAQELPFALGEEIVFSVNYGVLNAGTYTMSIDKGEALNGNEIYKITTTAKTNTFFDMIYKVRDEMESFWDADKFFSRRLIKRLNEGGWHQYRLQYFFEADTTAFDVKYKKGERKRKRFKALPEPQDELSIFYHLRMQNLNVGDTLVTNIIASGDTYKTKTSVLKKEKVETILGKVECLKVKPLLSFILKDTVNMYVWFTNDKYKIPVKLMVELKYGKFTFNLKETKNIKGNYKTD